MRRIKQFCFAIALLIAAAMLFSCSTAPQPMDIKDIIAAQEAALPEGLAEFTPPPTPSATRLPSASPSPSPSPTASPQPFGKQDVVDAFFATDILNYISPQLYQYQNGASNVETILAQPQVSLALPNQYFEWLRNSKLRQDIRVNSLSLDIQVPSWKLLSVLTVNYKDNGTMLREALQSACNFDVNITSNSQSTGKSGLYNINVRVTPKNPETLFYELPTGGKVTALDNTFTYAYLATLYDDKMQLREGIEPRQLPSLLFPIQNSESLSFVDGWCDDRDRGNRMHTGTDINAPEGTNLLACVDATVKNVGNSEKAGYYIVLEGADGTQYHYYHMAQASAQKLGAKVKQGDTVGHVGSTGNSTASHLHFAIITNDGYYLNPYPYLVKAQQQASVHSG